MTESLVPSSSDLLTIEICAKNINETMNLESLKNLKGTKIAIIQARRNKKNIVEETMKERQELFKTLRQENEQKIIICKHIIRKTHLGRLRAMKNQFDAISQRKVKADQVKSLQGTFKKQLDEAKTKEFQRKIELVQKMKYLEEISKAGKKKRIFGDYHRMSILEVWFLFINTLFCHNQLIDFFYSSKSLSLH